MSGASGGPSLGGGRDHGAQAGQAIALARHGGYQVLEGQAHAALASIHLDQHHHDQAIQHARQALDLQRAAGNRPAQLFLHLAITLLPLLLFIALLWQLRGLLRSARQGDPFTTANVRRLRQFGWLLLLGWPLVHYVTRELKQALASTLPANDTAGLYALDIGGVLLFGLAILVLAEVFAHGLRLREDVEGTI